MDNHITAERIADWLTAKNVVFEQKRMFGGVCFMVDNKMCIGTYQGGVMARVGPTEADALINRPGTSPMTNGSRPMKGYLFIEPQDYDSDRDLSFWVDKCLAFNPTATASKKKKA